MPKNTTNTPALVSYHQLPTGEHRGVITESVSRPYHVVIDAKGRWQIQDFGASDEPVTVASGKAHNVTRAKQQVTAQAIKHIDELQDAYTIDTTNPNALAKRTQTITNTTPPTREREREPSGAWRAVKVYIALALLCFAALLFARWMLLYRPSWFMRVMFWGGSSFVLAHRLITFIDDANKRLERMRRAPKPSQTHTMFAPRGRR